MSVEKANEKELNEKEILDCFTRWTGKDYITSEMMKNNLEYFLATGLKNPCLLGDMIAENQFKLLDSEGNELKLSLKDDSLFVIDNLKGRTLTCEGLNLIRDFYYVDILNSKVIVNDKLITENHVIPFYSIGILFPNNKLIHVSASTIEREKPDLFASLDAVQEYLLGIDFDNIPRLENLLFDIIDCNPQMLDSFQNGVMTIAKNMQNPEGIIYVEDAIALKNGRLIKYVTGNSEIKIGISKSSDKSEVSYEEENLEIDRIVWQDGDYDPYDRIYKAKDEQVMIDVNNVPGFLYDAYNEFVDIDMSIDYFLRSIGEEEANAATQI